MTCTRTDCMGCGEPMIHMGTRGAHESSSPLGQHIHDTYPTTFYYADVDAVIYKRANRMLRVIEHKYRGGSVKPSQKTILPLLAIGVRILVMVGYLHPNSGVYVVWSDTPFTTATAAKVLAQMSYCTGPLVDLDPDLFTAFKTGESVSVPMESAAS